jgi:hypothetical protein
MMVHLRVLTDADIYPPEPPPPAPSPKPIQVVLPVVSWFWQHTAAPAPPPARAHRGPNQRCLQLPLPLRDRRKRHDRKSKSIGRPPLTAAEKAAHRLDYKYLWSLKHLRPKTRGDCATSPRPCPYVSCKYHLAVDVSESGGLRINFPGLEVEDLIETCALDVADRGADRGGTPLEDVGVLTNVSMERARQVEVIGAREMRRYMEWELGVADDEPEEDSEAGEDGWDDPGPRVTEEELVLEAEDEAEDGQEAE